MTCPESAGCHFDNLSEHISFNWLLGIPERSHNLRLPLPVNRAVAREGRHHIRVAEVLAPRLGLLGGQRG